MPRPRLVGLLPKRVIDGATLEDSGIKSARRVIRLLEFFDDIRGEATMVQIAEALGMPQSSTSTLVHDLVKIGYLEHHVQNRTFSSSARVALLGSWVDRRLVSEGPYLDAMRSMQQLTGQVVVLVKRSGMYAQYIHIVRGERHNPPPLGTSHMRPLVTSGGGHALMSVMPEDEVALIVKRSNAENLTGDAPVKIETLLATLAEVRRRGYALTYAFAQVHCGLMIAPFPQGCDALALGIYGDRDQLETNRAAWSAVLKSTIERLAT